MRTTRRTHQQTLAGFDANIHWFSDQSDTRDLRVNITEVWHANPDQDFIAVDCHTDKTGSTFAYVPGDGEVGLSVGNATIFMTEDQARELVSKLFEKGLSPAGTLKLGEARKV